MGQRFDRLVAVRSDGKHSNGNWYWIYRCDCGVEISRIPGRVRKCKHNACPTCLRGPGHWAWEGVGDFSQEQFRALYHGARVRGLDFTISADYLWELFLSQDGKCAFTGWKLSLRPDCDSKRIRGTASLDRIDSTQGYIEGNVQWVHRDINKFKSNLPNERFISMCVAVSQGSNQRGIDY